MKLQKKSKQERWYDDACATAHALELVGERWALLVMRELLLGPRRFGDLRADLPGISANALTRRLESLAAAGIVTRQRLPPPASVPVYALTAWGLESAPLFEVMGRWAARSPGHDPRLPLSAVSLMLSFGTMFDGRRAERLAARIGLRIGDATFVAAIAAGRITVGRGDLDGCDTVFTGAATAVAAVVYGGQSLAAALATGTLAIAGDRALAARFTGLFPLPAKAAAPRDDQPPASKRTVSSSSST